MDFIKRHRNKFLIAGGAIGTLVVVKKILSNYEKQWQTSSSRGFVHEARKKEIHFENMINECNQICQRMYPKVIKHLHSILDDSHLLDALKSKSQTNEVRNKLEIWKSLKVKILTKLLSEIYCTSIMICCLRVQMSLAGGQVFAESVATNTIGSSSATVADLTHMKAYTRYITILSSFYDQRLDQLIQHIEQAVEEALSDYNLDHKTGIQDLKVILEKIKASMNFYLSSQSAITNLLLLDAESVASLDLAAICPDSGALNERDDKMLRKMLAETRDILESSDFMRVLERSIDVGYEINLDFLLGAFIRMQAKLPDQQGNFSNPNTIQVPLVRLLPEIRASINNRTEADQKVLVNHLLSLDILNCFAANIYEAFCLPK